METMQYTIGTITEYRQFIEALREKLAKRKEDGSKEEIKVEKLSVAVLPKRRELIKKQDQLLLIELHAKTHNNDDVTTLAMRKDNLYIVGFTGKGGKWFELAKNDCRLPKEWHSTQLPWDVSYKSIMNLLKDQDQVKRTLSNTRLGQAFAIRAVRRLSQYPDLDYGDDNPTRLGLAGLLVLIGESARMEIIRQVFRNRWLWEDGVVIDKDVLEHIWNWGTVSAALRRWKNRGYKEEYTGDSSLPDALGRLGLVLNSVDTVVEGGARVEIFAISANFHVTSITVTDDANPKGYPIYNHKGKIVTPPKNKLFVTRLPQNYVPTIIKDAATLGISNVSMEQLSDHKIELTIIEFRNEVLADSAFQHITCQLLDNEQVSMSWKDPRLKEKEMVDLELNVVSNGISGYKWFDLDIKSADAIPQGAVPWRLDCRKQGNGTEVVTHHIAFDSQRKMDVTYLVMSDTVKAKVEVRLRYQFDRHWFLRRVHTVHGEIAAHIDGFNHPIVLFRINDKSKAKPLEPWLIFPLERSEVWVPRCSKRVHIEIKHLYVTTGDREVVSIRDSLSFGFDLGDWRRASRDNDNELVEVNITWDGIPPKSTEPDVKWIVSDGAKAFTDHIEQLREKVVMHNDDRVLKGYKGTHLKDPPILAKPGRVEAERCVHIELQAKVDAESWTTTLVVRDDNCSGLGFMNKSQVWYDLGYIGYGWRSNILPVKYNSVFLGWEVDYNKILQASNWREELNKAAGLFTTTEDFVMNAVRTLSRYPDVEDGSMNPRTAVVVLMIVTCESAKLDIFHEAFQKHWGTNKVEFITEDMKDHVSAWEEMSRTLLHWKDNFYRSWPHSSDMLKQINITSDGLALEAVHLVLNRRALPDQIDVTYTIDDDDNRYTIFIDELRRTVTSTPYSGTLAGLLPRRPRDGDGQMWWNIQLKVVGKETSITLALSGHDLRICGFRGRNNIWYQIGDDTTTMFVREYDACAISIRMHYDPKWWEHSATYGMTAAIKAVDMLSSYPDPTLHPRFNHYKGFMEDVDGTERLVLPLMTLNMMVSYSASIRKVHNTVEQGWRLEAGTTADLDLLELMSFWDDISISALEQWQLRGDDAVQQGWLMEGRAEDRKSVDLAMGLSFQGDSLLKLLERIGIKSPQGALEAFALIKDADEK